MGREIRRVPPNWEHLKLHDWSGSLQPMYDSTYESARNKWLDGLRDWYAKPEIERDGYDWWEEEAPPDRDYYRPWKDEEATWYQLWETVSEGTPVSPPFETKEELAVYLAENGDWWDQERYAENRLGRESPGWGTEVANQFVFGPGWAPSFVSYGHGLKEEKLMY